MTALIPVDAAPRTAGGCSAAGAFAGGASLALPILLVVALLARRRRRAGSQAVEVSLSSARRAGERRESERAVRSCGATR